LESVANRLKVKLERLLAWEQGDLKPTVRQVQQLARLYQRPFGVFFLPQPPLLPPMAAEYRRLPGVEPGAESPELRLALRVMSHRRQVALDLIEELGNPISGFQTPAHLLEAPEGNRGRYPISSRDNPDSGYRSAGNRPASQISLF
jgi:transcriptional regulator with XRE-family HTH domain